MSLCICIYAYAKYTHNQHTRIYIQSNYTLQALIFKGFLHLCVCVCVCVWERERERERVTGNNNSSRMNYRRGIKSSETRRRRRYATTEMETRGNYKFTPRKRRACHGFQDPSEFLLFCFGFLILAVHTVFSFRLRLIWEWVRDSDRLCETAFSIFFRLCGSSYPIVFNACTKI